MLNRKFVTLDGNILAEEIYDPSPVLSCFYCDLPTPVWAVSHQCLASQHGEHELVTLVDKN